MKKKIPTRFDSEGKPQMKFPRFEEPNEMRSGIFRQRRF
jgi:hypothetical protein